MTHTIYICGPRTGIADENVPAIQACASRLRARGHHVISPVDVNVTFLGVAYSPQHAGRATYPGLRADIMALLSCCTAIALMPGWEAARGCRLEVAIGITLRYAFIDWQTGEVIQRPDFVVIDHGYGEPNPLMLHARTVTDTLRELRGVLEEVNADIDATMDPMQLSLSSPDVKIMTDVPPVGFPYRDDSPSRIMGS